MPPIGVFAPVFCETVAYLSSVFLAIFETLEIWKIAEACRKSWICTSGNLHYETKKIGISRETASVVSDSAKIQMQFLGTGSHFTAGVAMLQPATAQP